MMKIIKNMKLTTLMILLVVLSSSLVACGGSLAEATSSPESTSSPDVSSEPTAEISFPAETSTPTTPDPDSANRIVCETIRNTVSGSLADAVNQYNSGAIGLYDLGTIYNAWASGARNLNSSASGGVRKSLSRLITLAESTGSAGESGDETATVDGIVAFSSSLDSFSASCP